MKKTIIIFLLFVGVCVFAQSKNNSNNCSVIKKPINDCNCNHLKDTIYKNWKYDKFNRDFESTLSGKEIELISKCFANYTNSRIKKIFGVPNIKSNNHLEFNIKMKFKNALLRPDKLIIKLNERGRFCSAYIEYGVPIIPVEQ
jgi:hypothetical protein